MATRSRMMFLLRYFMEHTDPSHRATLEELQRTGEAQQVHIQYRTFSQDLAELRLAGFQIVERRKGYFKTYHMERLFSLRDQKQLLGAVLDSGKISEREKQRLVNKLLIYSSEQERIQLRESLEEKRKME